MKAIIEVLALLGGVFPLEAYVSLLLANDSHRALPKAGLHFDACKNSSNVPPFLNPSLSLVADSDWPRVGHRQPSAVSPRE